MFFSCLDFDAIVTILFGGSTNELNFKMNEIQCMAAAFPGRFLWEDLEFAACNLRRKTSKCCAATSCILWQLWSSLQFSSSLFPLILYTTYNAKKVVSSGTLYMLLLRWRNLTLTNHRSWVRPQPKVLSGFTRIVLGFCGRIYGQMHQLRPFFN